MNTSLEQRINVPFGFPVVFTDHVFSPDNAALHSVLHRLDEPGGADEPRAMVYIDANAEAGSSIAAAAEAWCKRWNVELVGEPHVVAGGEAVKNDWGGVERMMREMIEARLDRHAFVIIVGGGALLDAVGFAAALVHRGLRVIRIPTTTLAQCDGGVGVKNGVNFAGVKNGVGTFAPPFGVVNDFQLLQTLDDRDWRAGVAEAVKVAILRDAKFFDFLCENAKVFRERQAGPMRHLLQRCAELHIEHIRTGGDPFEMGRARPLDFGHWSAHKLELLSEFRVSHGDAVAAGIALDCAYAVKHGWLAAEDFRRAYRALRESGFSLWHEEMENAGLLDGLREFQEHLGGQLCVTFPDGIGNRREESEVNPVDVREALDVLRELKASTKD
jgi:3-dehydroquinate synthase